MGRQQTEMAGNMNPWVSALSQAGMPSSPFLGFSQALGKGSRGIFLYWGESCISLLQALSL